MEKEEVAYEVPLTLEDAREGLRVAKELFERSPGYASARALQINQRMYDAKIKEARDSFFHFDGSKGLHDLDPNEIMISALKEIVSRGRELQTLYKGIDYAPTDYVKYFYKVAEQCLKDVGINPDTFVELSVIR